MRFSFPSALPLLVAGVLANHPHHTAAANDFALLADLLDARSNLHDEFPLQLLGNLGSGRIVSVRADEYSVTLKQSDDAVARGRVHSGS